MKKLIYYPPGCYGTFINWLCNIKQTPNEGNLPFDAFGNSHKYYSDAPYTHLFSKRHREVFLKSTKDFGVLRSCWPFNVGIKLVNLEQQDNFYYQVCHEDLQQLSDTCGEILVLHPTVDSKVWWYQNFCEKVAFSESTISKIMPQLQRRHDDMLWLSTEDPVLRARHHLNLQKEQPELAKLFDLYNKTSALDFSDWQLRTVLADDLLNQTDTALSCWDQLKQDFDNIKFISIDNLRDSFQETVLDIFNFFNLDSAVIGDISFVETEWQKKQKHLHKDKLINNIVSAILTNQDLSWTGQINFFDEVYIQKMLTDQGIELLAVDVFPTTAKEFNEKVLYKNNNKKTNSG